MPVRAEREHHGRRGESVAIRDWQSTAAEMPSPVFIVGEARSGTSILYRSLQSHPRFMPAAGIDLVESEATVALLDLFGPADVGPGRLADFLLGQDALARVASDIAPLRSRRTLVRSATDGRIRRLPVWRAAGEHHVLRRYFIEAVRSRNVQRLVEKSPFNIRWVSHLGVAFPNARFIYMARHPLDVLSSYWRRYRNDPVTSEWGNITADTFCARWAENTVLAADIAKRDPRLMLIRYEEFTGRTEPSVRAVLDHVGEPFHEACLLQGERTTNWNVEPHLHGPVAERTKKWEEFIDRPTAQQVETRLRDVMAMTGFRARSNGD
jgi:sulfotransferase family protein